MKIQAAVSREKNKIAIEEVNICNPGPGELLVKLVASGYCHTDEGILQRMIPPPFDPVLGHEGAGIIEAVGDGCDGFAPGDHVIMTFPSCGHCHHCEDGHPYACSGFVEEFFGGPSTSGGPRLTDDKGELTAFFSQGSLATYSIVAARNAVKVPSDVDLKALCGMGCGFQTGAGTVLNRIKPEPGSSIVIFGCGTVGLCAMMAAKIAGCGTIIACDVVPSRLELALELGATHTVNSREHADVAARIREIAGGEGVDYAVESAGADVLMDIMLASMRPRGLAVVVSMHGDSEIPIKMDTRIMSPCVTLAGLLEGGSNPPVFIPQLIEYYKQGKFPVDKLCTYYKFEELEQAIEDSRTGKTIKPVIVF